MGIFGRTSIALCIVGGLSFAQIAIAKPQAAVAAKSGSEMKSLGMTPAEFQKAYNLKISQLDSRFQISSFSVAKGKVQDAYRAKLGNVVDMVGRVDTVSGKLDDVTLWIGSGSEQDNLLALSAMVTAAHATTRNASQQSISNAISTLMQKAVDVIDNPRAPTPAMVVGNRRYGMAATRRDGFLFTISDSSNMK